MEIIAVSNGSDALRKAVETKPVWVIADVFMPGLTGYEVCARLRQGSLLKNVPVILLVGAFESFDKAKANEVALLLHMMKPIEPQSLLRLVNSLLGNGGQLPVEEETYDAAAEDDSWVIDESRMIDQTAGLPRLQNHLTWLIRHLNPTRPSRIELSILLMTSRCRIGNQSRPVQRRASAEPMESFITSLEPREP